MPYRPPLTLTPAIVSLVADIAERVGRVDALARPVPQPGLRRRNRIRTVHSTVAIEGSPLDEAQVTAVLDGKRVLGGARELREVKNAITAYDEVHTLSPGRVADLLRAHRTLLDALAEDAGEFRRRRVGVVDGDRVAHVAPPASRVEHLVKQLLHDFVQRDKEMHAIIKSAVTHYEVEFIHPFSDGNGRVGRLWQHRILLDVHAVFAHVPVESVIRARQAEYYASLGDADRRGDAAPFVEFSLAATRDALSELVAELRPEPATGESRLARAREALGSEPFSRRDYARIFPALSAPTASRDLRAGVEARALERKGDKATARYRFVRSRDKKER